VSRPTPVRRRFRRAGRLPGATLGAVLGAVTIALTSVTGVTAASVDAEGRPGPSTTNATFYNDASVPAADPYVLYDKGSGYYYAYSTDGAQKGGDGTSYAFGVYRSADLATWEHLAGGALPLNEPNRWGKDWFWAPEVYHNESTGKYYLFYSARQRDNVARDFGYANFEEPSKVGVAVADSPAGPFHTITSTPLDYFPYDPDYHDVNLLMDATQRKPPATRSEGESAPLGTYIPFIDPDVYFDDDGRIYLYFSRNAYRNWVWDTDLGKYIEESNIYAVELTRSWWDDPTGQTKPAIADSYRNANVRPGAPAGARRDGYVPILSYSADKQDWENAHVNDYATSGGAKKDRRWEEGSSTFKRMVDTNGDGRKEAVYYLTYSANNFENAYYGVGYATASSPLGPWRKFSGNPILAQDPALPEYSTGHGSPVLSPDGSQAFYVHHGRSSTTGGRRLYTDRMELSGRDANGAPVLSIDESVSDTPIPSGVAPFSITAGARVLQAPIGSPTRLDVAVHSRAGAALALSNPLNRIRFTIDRPDRMQVADDGDGGLTVTALRPGAATVTVTYQRRLAAGGYRDITQDGRPVSTVVTVVGKPAGG
jgi:hypothetical protein